MYIPLGIMLMFITYPIKGKELRIRDLHNEPILLLETDRCFIQTGTLKIVHPINITNLENNAKQFQKIAGKISKTLPISNLIQDKSKVLQRNLDLLKPSKARRYKRWDAIGTTWKWIAGTPDADDLRIINTTLNELIAQNNAQVHINNVLNVKIAEMTSTINSLIDKYADKNKITLQEMEAITLLIYMDNTNRILEEIEDTVLRTHVNLPNSKLLTLNEITAIETVLNNQGINTSFPEEALNYVKPKIASKDNILFYILHVPQLQKVCKLVRVIPLPVNGMTATNIPPYVVKSENEFFETMKPLEYVQLGEYLTPFKDNCLTSIIMGKESHCTAIPDNETTVMLISNDKVLVFNADNLSLQSNCGPHNRTLTGNFMLSFNNCSIAVANQTFQTSEQINTLKEIQGAYTNLNITWKTLQIPNISKIENDIIINRQHLERISLKQYTHTKITFSMLGGLSITVIIIATIFAVISRKKSTIIIKQSPQNRKNRNRTEKSEKSEDVHFSPPGGVTPATT